MVDLATVKRLAGALPEVSDDSSETRLAFSVDGKGFAWSYLVREKPKGPRVPVLGVLAIRCPIERKEMLIEAAPGRFFDDDHYRGYPAVLARLELVDEEELAGLLRDGWRAVAPKAVLKRAGLAV